MFEEESNMNDVYLLGGPTVVAAVVVVPINYKAHIVTQIVNTEMQ